MMNIRLLLCGMNMFIQPLGVSRFLGGLKSSELARTETELIVYATTV